MPATQTTQKDPVIVVLQLTGGNDYLNTVIPYNNPLYRDNRKAVGIPDNQIMHLDQGYGIPHYMAPLKQFWDDKKLAILHGVGYAELAAVALPLDGHLAHLRAGKGRDRRMARPGGARIRPQQRERRHHRQLWAEPAAVAVGAGRAGGVRRRRAGKIRLPADGSGKPARAGARPVSSRCTSRSPAPASWSTWRRPASTR